MGGGDKTRLPVAGRTLLEWVESGLAGANRTIVVGPEVDGGPVAGAGRDAGRAGTAEPVGRVADLVAARGRIGRGGLSLRRPGDAPSSCCRL